MKRLATLLALTIFATAAFAAEPADKQKSEEKAKAEKPATKATASTSGAATPTEPANSGTNAKSLNAPAPGAGAVESPLAAAARKANRLGKTPQILINDQNLKTSGQGAHVTTTKKQEEIVISPTAGKTKTPEMIEKENRYREEKKKEIADANAKKAEAAKENRLGLLNSEVDADGHMSEADPAAVEAKMAATGAKNSEAKKEETKKP